MRNKQLNLISKLLMFALVYFIGVYTAMYYCYKQPIDEYILIHNREINFPEQECYTRSDIELIVYGK
tara:strand:+ start:3212 stop:3412 length:201 start_codon:yes stop_codon:yes gene_type:complete